MVDISEEPDSEITKNSSGVEVSSEGIDVCDEMALINAVAAKHRQLLDTYNAEFAALDPQVSKLKEQSGEEKRERNEINERVAVLKEKRQLLYHHAKQLRIEMFDLINVNKNMQKNEQEMARLQKEVEALDWKLQTTVMGIKKEREIVEKIKKLSARIEEINESTPIDGTDEDKSIKRLSAQIKEMMEEADGCHKELVSIADEAQEHHGSFVEYAEQLKGVRGRYIWLQSRIKSHKDAVDYWEDKLGKTTAESGTAEGDRGD